MPFLNLQDDTDEAYSDQGDDEMLDDDEEMKAPVPVVRRQRPSTVVRPRKVAVVKVRGSLGLFLP